MAAYSSQAMYAPYEKWKIDQLMFGLRDEFSHNVYHREFTTYAEPLRQCYIAENSLKKIWEETKSFRFGQRDQGKPIHHLNTKPSTFKGKQGRSIRLIQPLNVRCVRIFILGHVPPE